MISTCRRGLIFFTTYDIINQQRVNTHSRLNLHKIRTARVIWVSVYDGMFTAFQKVDFLDFLVKIFKNPWQKCHRIMVRVPREFYLELLGVLKTPLYENLKPDITKPPHRADQKMDGILKIRPK